MRLVDFAGGRPGAAALKAAGIGGVIRYLDDGGPGLPGKLLLPDEFQDYLHHGLNVVFMKETTATRMTGGAPAGKTDAINAKQYIMSALGLRASDIRAIYFACDWDATPEQQTLINDYLRGTAFVLGHDVVGLYGGYWPLLRAHETDLTKWYEQTTAWSGTNRVRWAHLRQTGELITVNGVPCDVVESLSPDFGQYPAPTEGPTIMSIWDELVDNPWRTVPGGDANAPAQLPARVLLGWAATHAALGRKEIIDMREALLRALPALIQEVLKDSVVTVEVHTIPPKA